MDENGTVASAATVVMIMNAMSMPVEIKEVYLDRPFFFMIMDEQTNLPLFMGAVNNIK
ncbi:serpin family protein [Candidatus Epulonipiscium viviparus]|uniref:serpin family protein n=1 Tax=Candidatus Epulonipiscium viviparus TaxID=420336 RepID=UPI00016C09E9|nr:serpin family protein [Candidatus Epulopiscium viviparus]